MLFALALVTVAAAGVGHEVTGAQVRFTLLCLLPVSFGAWFVGTWGGLALALASAVATWAADVAAGASAPGRGGEAVNVAMDLAVFALVASLVAALRDRLRRETTLARTDALTGLANRREFMETGAREVARAVRTGRPLTLAVVDVDRFKEFNDLGGHEAGDDVLRRLGSALRGALRAVDLSARLGGDEFALLLPETDGAVVDVVLDRVRLVLTQAAAESGSGVTLSMGAATFERPPVSLDEMLRAADRMLDEVKAAGRDGLRRAQVG